MKTNTQVCFCHSTPYRHCNNCAEVCLAYSLNDRDRVTLETISALLNGDSNQVEVVKGYIRNKLRVYDEIDRSGHKFKPGEEQ